MTCLVVIIVFDELDLDLEKIILSVSMKASGVIGTSANL